MRRVPLLLTCAGLFTLLAPAADAQRASRSTRVKELATPQSNLYPAGLGPGARGEALLGSPRPAIMLTGYWPPTNNMLRRFSDDPVQNPMGWVGLDWEGRGYDVYAYFAEFPSGPNQGVGDLEVDYQDTSQDFWQIADSLRPIAIVTFSRGSIDRSWEVETKNRNLSSWVNDYTPPLQPTPAPPDASVPAGTVRPSTLPVQKVLDAVEAANVPNLDAYIDINSFGGGFLSEFIAYHGVWYQALHASPADPAWCVAAGHVHVGALLPAVNAREAVHQTIRAVLRYVDEVRGTGGGETQWFCVPSQTSQSFGAILTSTGSYSVAQNDFELQVVNTVAGNFGLAFYGANPQAPAPLGEGSLCVAAPLYRLSPAVQADAQGFVRRALDLGAAPLGSGAGQVLPGSTWHFQYWLRDPGGGPSGFNTSSALSITFAP